MRLVVGLLLAAAFGLSSAPSAAAQLGMVTGFEKDPDHNWDVIGNAGFDMGKGLAYSGESNGWIRSTSGWNALVLTFLGTPPLKREKLACRAQAYVRASTNVTNLFLSFIDPVSGHIYGELGPFNGYWLETTATKGYMLMTLDRVIDGKKQPPNSLHPAFRIGFWGNGQDAWVQVDEVYFACDRGTVIPQRRG